jgi:hypothetical protein
VIEADGAFLFDVVKLAGSNPGHSALPLFIVPTAVRICLGAGDAGMVVILAVLDGSGR